MTSIFSLINKKIETVRIKDELLDLKSLKLSVLRLDLIHPVASGNKIFKLSYFIDEAQKTGASLLTFGGAYSNHLTASAWVCREMNLSSIGIVRGERPARLSHTLQFCLSMGMDLQFISREKYKLINEPAFISELRKNYGDFVLVPEGGSSATGVRGASQILEYLPLEKFTHLCLSIGTGTTMAGLRSSGIKILGFPALKGMHHLASDIESLLEGNAAGFSIFNEYHFGGYAKYTAELSAFMNRFYKLHNIPTDFVYTGKMFFGVWDLVKKNYFPFNSNILCIHTGGLQGNLSLPANVLDF